MKTERSCKGWVIKTVFLLCVIFSSLQIQSYAQVILEAENAYFSSGKVDTKHPGYTGSGFVDTQNAIGEYIEWVFNSSKSLTNPIDFRYALGKDEHRLMQIFVNDILIDTIDFDSTYLFTNYQYKSVTAKLDSGLNKVRVVSISEQGAPNMDHLRIYADTLPLPYYSITIIASANGQINLNPALDSFKAGSNVIVTAVPDAGFTFGNWTVGATSSMNPLNLLVDKDIALGATFINSLPAFPGAEGFATTISGGRGGVVYEVTNLNDNGAGSLRYAVQQSGKRTVVFRVSGTIQLQSALKITSGDITIAGQTAPGDGITISGYPLNVSANNVIIRYIRTRLGDVLLVQDDAMNGTDRKDIIIDHCTMSWSVDECASFYDNTNFTMQYCILSESLYHSIHVKGDHGYGGIWGGKGATFHHNLLAHHTSRNPRFCGSRYSNLPDQELVDFRNNVIFNWGKNSGYAGEGGRYNMVNNYYKYGPATGSGIRDRIFAPNADDGTNAQPAGVWGMFYVAGNYIYEYPNTTENNWIGMDPTPSTKPISEIKSETEFSVARVETHTAQIAFEHVLAQAGSSFPKRDVVDNRIIQEVISGIPTYGASYGAGRGIIDTQEDVGGWPVLNSIPAPQDSDHDGMPDAWETAHGLSSSNPDDRNGDSDADGYTNLEEYLNELVSAYTYIIRPLNFDAQKLGTSKVSLSWEDVVDNETGYLIERSSGAEYELIATTAANSITYEDNVLADGNFSYRIRTFNSADTSLYSDTANVSIFNGSESITNHEYTVSIYPNPFKDQVFVQFQENVGNEIQLSIYNSSGRKLETHSVKNTGFGIYAINLAGSLPNGIYYLSIITESGIHFKKLLKH